MLTTSCLSMAKVHHAAIFLLAARCLIALVIEYTGLNSVIDCMACCFSMSHACICPTLLLWNITLWDSDGVKLFSS